MPELGRTKGTSASICPLLATAYVNTPHLSSRRLRRSTDFSELTVPSYCFCLYILLARLYPFVNLNIRANRFLANGARVSGANAGNEIAGAGIRVAGTLPATDDPNGTAPFSKEMHLPYERSLSSKRPPLDGDASSEFVRGVEGWAVTGDCWSGALEGRDRQKLPAEPSYTRKS